MSLSSQFDYDHLLIMLGLLGLLISLVVSTKFLFNLKERRAKVTWAIMECLIVLFALSYGGIIALKYWGRTEFLTNLVSLVLCLGSVFVLLSVAISSYLNSALQEYAETLEEKVEKRTAELVEVNGKLLASQEALIASSKMAALGEMAGGIAHEINNPLAIITTLSTQIPDYLDGPGENRPMVKEMLGDIEVTALRIAKIVQGLRYFSRDGSKDPTQRISISGLLNETLSFCRTKFENSGVEISIDPFPNDLSVEGRATQISQVLLNLLNNAYDAISHYNNRWIRISVGQALESIEIRVVDCGPGIPKELHSKIFQPFFTTKEIGKGTGLGLSISSGIIRDHKGELVVDQYENNTCFLIRLPKSQEQLAMSYAEIAKEQPC